MSIAGLVLLTIKVLVRRKGINNIMESRIVLQLKKGSRRLRMRKSQVGERILFLSSVSSVASWPIVRMNAIIKL